MTAEPDPTRQISLTIPADWLAQIEVIANRTQRTPDEVYREAIARLLGATVQENAEIARLKTDLAQLQQQLPRLAAAEAALTRLSHRLERVETAATPPAPASSTNADAGGTTKLTTPTTPTDNDEDWGLFDDEPDEVLIDFLP